MPTRLPQPILGLFALLLVGVSTVVFWPAAALSPEQEAFLARLETVEDFLGREGYTDDLSFLRSLQQEAAALDLPVAEARVRLLQGRIPMYGRSEVRAQLELAAETFRDHAEPGWEARARLKLARLLSMDIDHPLFVSGQRDAAVSALRAAVRLAREAKEPLIAGEAHWLLGDLHRTEESLGLAIRSFERAEEAFGVADEPLLVLIARTELAKMYSAIGDLAQAQAVLELALTELTDGTEAGVDELARWQDEQRERLDRAQGVERTRRMAAQLRERGFPDMAEYFESVASFMSEWGERIEREGWSEESARAAAELQHQLPAAELEPLWPVERTGLGAREYPPLDEFIAEHPDQALAHRVLEVEIGRELDELEREIRDHRLQMRLSGPDVQAEERFFARLLAAAERTGTMADLPVDWFVRQLETAPEQYREDGALVLWVELRAADLYVRLGKRLGDRFRGLPTETTALEGRSVSSWALRFCERLRTALERTGTTGQSSCDLRTGFVDMTGRFTVAAGLHEPFIAPGTAIDVLEERKERLEALSEDPSRLAEEMESPAFRDFFEGVLPERYHSPPKRAVLQTNAPMDRMLVLHELLVAQRGSPGLEDRIAEVSCILAQRRVLHRWLAVLADRNGLEEQAARHRARQERLQNDLREAIRPTSYSAVGGLENLEPSWGVGCSSGATPSFLGLRTVEAPEPGHPGWARSQRWAALDSAEESLEAGRYREALRVFRAFDASGIDRPEIRASVLDGLGRSYLGLGDRSRALDAFLRSVDAWEEVVGGFDRAAHLSTYFGGVAGTYDRVIELLAVDGRQEDAFHYAERARARALLQRLGSAPVGRAGFEGVPEILVEEMNALRARQIVLENLQNDSGTRSRDGSNLPPPDEVARRLEDTRRRLLDVLGRIDTLRGGDGDSVTGITASTLDEVRRLLPENTALVEYHLLPERGLVWIVGREGVRMVEIPETREWIGEDVEDLLVSIAERGAYRDRATDLYRLLVAPVRPHLAGRDVVLIPHGPLHRLPFGALVNPETGRHLVEELTWTTMPSASTLRRSPEEVGEVPERPLVIGDPEVAAAARLPRARDSARTVARMLDAELLLRDQATEAAVRDRLPVADLVHFGTHAFLSETAAELNWIALTPGPEGPWVATDDGRLELHEIRRLDLRHVELVILAACETAVGDRTDGDDVAALQRGFLESGARRVIATLWPAADEASAAWSEAFYRRLGAGESVAEAANRAQRELLGDDAWRHPYFWAGFVASGPPQPG